MKKAILTSTRTISRFEGSKAFPLNEPNLPKGNGSPESLTEIVKFLKVENSARYKQNVVNGSIVATYCNIYAFDYCNLAGGYLPRVWWKSDLALKIKLGADLEAQYGKTVFELNANALLDWFVDYSDLFGWQKQNDLKEAQRLANEGWIVIIVAKQKNTARAGHITAIVPETNEHRAILSDSKYLPLQSQAGAVNHSYLNQNWFENSRFSAWGIWAYKAF